MSGARAPLLEYPDSCPPVERMERLSNYGADLKGRYHKARYEFAKRFCAGKKVLDVACGSGEGTKILAAVAAEAMGVDPFLKSSSTDERVLSHGYIETLPDISYEVAVCFETIEHTISIELTILMLASALAEDGMLILSFPNKWGETAYHFHDTDQSMLAEIESHFRITGLYGQCRKSHVIPVKISRDAVDRYENILITAIKDSSIVKKPSYEDRIAMIYEECSRRQTQKINTLGFRCKVLPARMKTKFKRLFGVR